MCTFSGENLKKWNPAGRLLGDKGFRLADPLMYASEKDLAGRLDAMSPQPAVPVMAQGVSEPVAPTQRRTKRTPGTLLTTPAGVTPSTLNLGSGNTLLGG